MIAATSLRRGILGCGGLLVLFALTLLLGGLLIGAFFFPIGPEGLSQRDVFVRQITDLLLLASLLTCIPGLLLAAVGVIWSGWAWMQSPRTSDPAGDENDPA